MNILGKRRRKTIGIFIAIFAAGLFVFGVCLNAYLGSDHFRQFLLKKINTSIAGSLTMAGHEISLPAGRIVLKNLVLKDPQGSILLSLDELWVDISFLPLLKRTVLLETFILRHPDVRLAIDKEGVVNVVRALQPSSPKHRDENSESGGIPVNVIAQNIMIDGGNFQLKMPSNHFGVQVAGITIQAKADLFKRTADIDLRIDKAGLSLGEDYLEVHPVNLSAALAGDRLESLRLKAETDFAAVDLEGEVRQVFQNPEIDLRLAFEMSLAAMNRFARLPYEFTGETRGVMTVRGNRQDPDADLTLTYDGGFLAGYPVDRLKAHLNLNNDRLLVCQLDILAASGEIDLAGEADVRDVFPQGFLSSEIRVGKIGYAVHAGLRHIDIAFFNKDDFQIQGILNATAAIEGKGVDVNSLSASGTIDADLEQFNMSGIQIPANIEMQTSAKMTAGTITLERLAMVAAKTRLDARGAFDTASGQIQGNISAQTENIADSLSLFNVVGYDGACTVIADVSGPWKQPDIAVDISGRDVRIHRTRLGDIHLSGNMGRNGLVNVAAITLMNQGTHLEGSGSIQLFREGFRLHETMPLQAGVELFDAEISDFIDDMGVGGRFQAKIQLNGAVQSLIASAQLHAKDLEYASIFLGEVDVNARFLEGGLILDRLRLTNQSTSLQMSGGARIFAPDSWERLTEPDLTLEMKGDVAAINDYIPGIEGHLYAEASLQGPMSELKGKGELMVENFLFSGQGVQSITANVELKENRLYIQPLRAVLDPESLVIGSGWIDLNGGFSLDLISENLMLNSIEKIREMQKVEGKADWHVRGEGNIRKPSIQGEIHLKEVRVNNEKLDDFQFHVTLFENQVSIKGQQTFELDSAYHLTNQVFHLKLLFKDTELSPFFLAMGVKEMGGIIRGNIVAEGNLGDILMSSALLDITGLSLEYQGNPLIDTDRIQGTLQNESLLIPEFRLNVLQSGQLRIEGSGNFDGSIDLSADGEIPAKSASFFLKDVAEFEGDVRIHAEVKGSIAQPDILAEVVLQDVGCTLPQISSPFKGINGKISLTPAQVTIENIVGTLDSGRFEVNGEAMLDKFRPQKVRMELTARQLPILIPQTMDMLVNTDLTAEGTGERIDIGGDIVILEGLYYKKVKLNLLQKVAEKRRPSEASPGQGRQSILAKIFYDIQLKYREPFIVDNNVAYLEISPDLKISGTMAAPVISGIAKVQEGTLTYQNKKFVVERGIISFVNPYKIEPEIDIAGSIQIRDWRISLTLYGAPERLFVDLSSLPAEEDADIISLLVFGKTTYEIREGDEGAVSSTAALLAVLNATPFGEELRKATGLDYLEITSTTGGTENQPDTVQMTMGKDLTERLSVKYTIGTGSSGYDQRAATEYKLLENFMLSGFQDTKGSYGGEIIFRVEFR
jgi:autotransporter translocation and assembly factor TamB